MKTNITITRQSPFTGKYNEMVIFMDSDDYVYWLSGEKKIQDALSYLTAAEREFIMTGITPQEWTEMFGDE